MWRRSVYRLTNHPHATPAARILPVFPDRPENSKNGEAGFIRRHRTIRLPPVPSSAARPGLAGAGNLTIQCFYSDDFFAKFAVFFCIVLVTYNCVYIGD